MTDHETHKNAILTAIEDAARELEKLQARACHLVEFIRLGRILLGEPAQADQPTPSPHKQGNQLASNSSANQHEQRSAADWGKALLEEVQHPMRVVDIAQELVQRGVLRGKWGTEVLRAGMARREDLERIAVGVYAIREWPPALKEWSQPISRGSTHAPRRKYHKRRKGQVSLADEALHIVETAGREMSLDEITKAVAITGRRVSANSVSARLGDLVSGGRLQKTGLGKYAPLGWGKRETNLSDQRQGLTEETLVFEE